jgi:hypothetical protein
MSSGHLEELDKGGRGCERCFRTALTTSSGESGIAGGGRGGLELGNPKTLESKSAGGHGLEKSSVSLTPQSRPAGQG